MNLIIILEILILFQKALNQYAPNQNYHRSQQYTEAAYYLPSQNEEYSWRKGNQIKTRKSHRKRKKYNDYYISAELDYGAKRLQCKCTCKRKYIKPILEYEQSDPCCPCDSKSDASEEYLPPQYPDAKTNGISIPTQFPYPFGIYTPAVYYPSMIYHTLDLVEIGKVFPWLTTKTGDDKDKTTTRDDKDKASTRDDRDDRDKSTKSDDKDKSTTRDDRADKDKSSESDDKNQSTTKDDRADKDKSSERDDKDQSTTRDDRADKDKSSESVDKDKSTTRDDRVKTSKEDDINKTTKIDDTDEPGKDEKDESSSTEESTTSTTTKPTISTYPYVVNEKVKRLQHYLPKKKHCLRDNDCVRKDTNRIIGRYFEDDLVERPTIASYLNRNGRRNNFPRKLIEDIPYYSTTPIPDKLTMEINELKNSYY